MVRVPDLQATVHWTFYIELSRARIELCRSRPEADFERLAALGNLAGALSDSGDNASARPLFEELVAVLRQTRGNDHPSTLDAISRLGTLLSELGDDAGAQQLLEEAIAGLRLTLGDRDNLTVDATRKLAVVHLNSGAVAKARLLLEQAVMTLRQTQPANPNTFAAIGNLGVALLQAGDITAGLALKEDAAASVLRELGPDHPVTQQLTAKLAGTWQVVAGDPSGTRATGILVGLASKPELNGKLAYVVGFDAAKGRYRVRHEGNMRTGKPIGIKPENLSSAKAQR